MFQQNTNVSKVLFARLRIQRPMHCLALFDGRLSYEQTISTFLTLSKSNTVKPHDCVSVLLTRLILSLNMAASNINDLLWYEQK